MREKLEKRLKVLETSYDNAIAQANALHGAIAEVKYWLVELENTKDQETENDG